MKSLLGAILLFFVTWLLLVEIVAASGATSTRIPPETAAAKGSFKRLDVIPRDSQGAHHLRADPNYMSKRKVPNGPDPIHNRRAGKSGQSPGRA
ncbi:hypothetical protein ACHQM5_005975 [Ranunculus cassubicifolius]